MGNTTAITSGTSCGAVSTLETRGYNALSQVVTDTLSGPGTPAQTTLTACDDDGNVVQVQQPNGDVTYTTYGLDERLKTVEVDPGAVNNPGSSPAKAVFALYGDDNAGNVTSSEGFDQRICYLTLDGDKRTTRTTDYLNGGTSFDPDGNTLSRTTQTQPLGCMGSAYQGVERLACDNRDRTRMIVRRAS